MGIWPFRRSRADEDAERLLDAVQAAARRPALYVDGGVPDTLEGRFEAMTAMAALALIRLKAAPEAESLAQIFTDQLFRRFDAGLREAGVGDTSVPKRMHKLAGSFYGRLESYSAGIAAFGAEDLVAALSRNIGVSGAFATQLASYIRHTAQQQAETPVSALLSPQAWPDFPT